MKHLVAIPLDWRLLFISSIAVILVAACSTLPPPEQAKDPATLKGRWEGWGTNSSLGPLYIRLAVHEGGQWEMATRPAFFSYGTLFTGTVTVDEGKFRFETETPGLSGSAITYYKEGRRFMIFTSDDGNTKVEMTRVY
jgi:hypothetical protein